MREFERYGTFVELAPRIDPVGPPRSIETQFRSLDGAPPAHTKCDFVPEWIDGMQETVSVDSSQGAAFERRFECFEIGRSFNTVGDVTQCRTRFLCRG